MQSSISVVLLIVLFAGVVELCGNVNTATPAAAENKTEGGRKRRHVYNVDEIQVELHTTLTSASDVEFSKIENVVGPAYEQLVAGAKRHVQTDVNGITVMKYTLINADCGEAQLFARAIKDTTSFVTGATVTCNNQVSNM
uniref:Cystatin domain-containing protein n=1 Tax=Caenorhabditis japonica TaxID=281687 RepID=A0A8R1HZP2_CAEJA